MAALRLPPMLIRCSCFCIVSGVDEALMANEEVAPRERLRADVAHERLFFGVCSAGRLSVGTEELHAGGDALPDVPLQMLEPGEQALTVRARQRLCLCG